MIQSSSEFVVPKNRMMISIIWFIRLNISFICEWYEINVSNVVLNLSNMNLQNNDMNLKSLSLMMTQEMSHSWIIRTEIRQRTQFLTMFIIFSDNNKILFENLHVIISNEFKPFLVTKSVTMKFMMMMWCDMSKLIMSCKDSTSLWCFV